MRVREPIRGPAAALQHSARQTKTKTANAALDAFIVCISGAEED